MPGYDRKQRQTQPSGRPAPRPLDARRLDELAVRYVGRYATTRLKLTRYLQRKLSERGWTGDEPAPVERVVERCCAAGYVDDGAFATARAGALSRRGYGDRRIGGALREAGIADDIAQNLRMDDEQALAAAMRFARRRRIGPFTTVEREIGLDRRQMASMARAGHSFEVIKLVFGSAGDDQD